MTWWCRLFHNRKYHESLDGALIGLWFEGFGRCRCVKCGRIWLVGSPAKWVMESWQAFDQRRAREAEHGVAIPPEERLRRVVDAEHNFKCRAVALVESAVKHFEDMAAATGDPRGVGCYATTSEALKFYADAIRRLRPETAGEHEWGG